MKPTIEQLKKRPALFYCEFVEALYITYPTGKVEYDDGSSEIWNQSASSGKWTEIEHSLNQYFTFISWLD